MGSVGDRRTRLRGLCPSCRHPWSEHPGALHDASVVGACGDCVYEAEHADRAGTCSVHLPDALALLAPRLDFAVRLPPASRAAGLGVLLDVLRPDAVALAFDLPEDERWPADARSGAAVLRAAAHLPADASYRTVDWLPVDEDVWPAFRAAAPYVHDCDVWGDRGIGDALLETSHDGGSVVAALRPDQYATALHRLPAGALDRLSPRAALGRRLRVWRPGRREPGRAWGMTP
ncbi:hypothetical protein [Cellulomonas biazotea]|uniref:Uncharacterized protein n=1 Tax=Cellulomonas biazotea TaxID=1709 RepID=A0A402DTU8_9CELL|nr:hypothetical protein [Cellulomonas biazotea]GCE77535.1 hypothetical protein CBZ_25910 [Cellulomonas biazotea]